MEGIRSNCRNCTIPACFLSSLPDAEKDRFNGRVELTFKKGQIICKQGSFASHVVFLKEGLVKLYTEGAHKNTIISIYKPQIYIGLISVFGNDYYQFSASAINETKVCLIDINSIKQLILNNRKLALDIITYISQSANFLLLNKVNIEQKQIRGRLAFVLLFLSRKVFENNTFYLPITRKEIAEFAGMSTENVITLLSEFRRDGFIKNEGKHFEIVDTAGLEEISNRG